MRVSAAGPPIVHLAEKGKDGSAVDCFKYPVRITMGTVVLGLRAEEVRQLALDLADAYEEGIQK